MYDLIMNTKIGLLLLAFIVCGIPYCIGLVVKKKIVN